MTAQRINLFGSFRAEPPLTFSGRQAQRLLVYLLLHPGQPHGRDQLATHLWPDTPPDRGRRALSDALYRLRGPDLAGLERRLLDARLPPGPALLVSSRRSDHRAADMLSARLDRPVAYLDAADPPPFYQPPPAGGP